MSQQAYEELASLAGALFVGSLAQKIDKILT